MNSRARDQNENIKNWSLEKKNNDVDEGGKTICRNVRKRNAQRGRERARTINEVIDSTRKRENRPRRECTKKNGIYSEFGLTIFLRLKKFINYREKIFNQIG